MGGPEQIIQAAEEIAGMDERQILAECTARITALDAKARAVRNHVNQ